MTKFWEKEVNINNIKTLFTIWFYYVFLGVSKCLIMLSLNLYLNCSFRQFNCCCWRRNQTSINIPFFEMWQPSFDIVRRFQSVQWKCHQSTLPGNPIIDCFDSCLGYNPLLMRCNSTLLLSSPLGWQLISLNHTGYFYHCGCRRYRDVIFHDFILFILPIQHMETHLTPNYTIVEGYLDRLKLQKSNQYLSPTLEPWLWHKIQCLDWEHSYVISFINRAT